MAQRLKSATPTSVSAFFAPRARATTSRGTPVSSAVQALHLRKKPPPPPDVLAWWVGRPPRAAAVRAGRLRRAPAEPLREF